MSIYQQVSDKLSEYEAADYLHFHAVLLSDEAFEELQRVVREEDLARQQETEQAQEFLTWVSNGFGVERKVLASYEPRDVSWGDTLFGLPIKRLPTRGYVIDIEASR